MDLPAKASEFPEIAPGLLPDFTIFFTRQAVEALAHIRRCLINEVVQVNGKLQHPLMVEAGQDFRQS